MTHRQAIVHAMPHPHAGPAVRHRSLHRSFNHSIHILFDRFLLLPAGAVLALVWANTAPESYFVVTSRLAFFVNEIGMAFFFALLGQEILEAVMPGGALHPWRRWVMPIVGALG